MTAFCHWPGSSSNATSSSESLWANDDQLFDPERRIVYVDHRHHTNMSLSQRVLTVIMTYVD